jgi:hypothetical protein
MRGGIYVSLAMLAAFGGWLNDLTPDRLPTLTWLDWCGMGVSVVSGGLIALRSFVDGSAERSRTKNEENENKP